MVPVVLLVVIVEIEVVAALVLGLAEGGGQDLDVVEDLALIISDVPIAGTFARFVGLRPLKEHVVGGSPAAHPLPVVRVATSSATASTKVEPPGWQTVAEETHGGLTTASSSAPLSSLEFSSVAGM